jgi:hypothetical protein
VYSPIVVPLLLAINKSDPDTAMPCGPFNPEINDPFTVAPDVVYSAIDAEFLFPTNRSVPDTAIHIVPTGSETSEEFTVAPDVVYSPTASLPKPL